MHTLSPRQREVLEAIVGYGSYHGDSPTLALIAAVVGLSGAPAVHRHIVALEKQGWIRRAERARVTGGRRKITVLRRHTAETSGRRPLTP
jgi:SOS-response transcriptional repressor LexA